MNYYSHHIGDYLSATAHLTLLEHGAYRRMIDVYYIHESALPSDRKQVYRLVGARTKEEREAVDSVLGEFFTESESGWMQSRCDHEISLCDKNRINGKKGGRPSKSSNPINNPEETQTKPKLNPEITQTESPPSPHHPITPSPEVSISENTTTTTSTVVTADEPPMLLSSDFEERCKTVADRLSALEEKRGVKFRFSALEGRLQAWVKAGITDPQLREAYDLALYQRSKSNSDAAINYGFLDTFVRKVMQDEEATVTPIAVKPWHESASGIEAKGAELGIPPPLPETGGFPAFKERVFAAARQAVAA